MLKFLIPVDGGQQDHLKQKRFLNNEKGFSLGEIIITMGIIGMISAISIPNYLKHSRRAKTAEAKSSLGQVYLKQKAFHLRWRAYITNLQVLGVSPEGTLVYNVGFSANNNNEVTDYNGTIDNKFKDFEQLCGTNFGSGADSGAVKSCAFRDKKDNPFETVCEITGDYKVDATGFKVAAVANLRKTNPKTCADDEKDLWSVDQYKRIKHEIKDGIKAESSSGTTTGGSGTGTGTTTGT